MDKVETIEAFYKKKFDWMPENFKNEIGHFNVFAHEPIDPSKSKPLPYKRRDFYKVMLVVGDTSLDVKKSENVEAILKRLRAYRGRLPADFKFDRLEANERR